MLSVRLGKYTLDLRDNASLQIDLFNPAGFEDKIVGDHSIPYVFPNTDNNHKAFKFASSLGVKNRVLVYDDVDIVFNGNQQLRGQLVLMRHNEEGYHASIGAYSAKTLLDTNLRDVQYDADINIPNLNALENLLGIYTPTSQTHYPHRNFTFPPIYSRNFYKNSNFIWFEHINAYDPLAFKYFTNQHYRSLFTPAPPWNICATSILPVLYVQYVLDKAFAGYTLRGEYFNDPELYGRLLLYNNHPLDRFDSNWFNDHLTGVMRYKNHVPNITIQQLLLAMKKAFNLSVKIDIVRKQLIVNFSDKKTMLSPQNLSKYVLKRKEKRFNSLEQPGYEFVYDWGSNKIKEDDFRYQDLFWTNPHTTKVREHLRDFGKGKRVSLGWAPAGSYTHDINVTASQYDAAGWGFVNNIQYPSAYIDFEANNPQINQNNDLTDVVFFFWRGFFQHNLTNAGFPTTRFYPLASANNHRYNYTNWQDINPPSSLFPFSWSLWNEPNRAESYLNKAWGNWRNKIVNNLEVDLDFDFPEDVLENLKMDEPIQVDFINYWIKSVKKLYSKNKIQVTRITASKMN
jgi:hypothetical protein